jgi:hypothetical protein
MDIASDLQGLPSVVTLEFFTYADRPFCESVLCTSGPSPRKFRMYKRDVDGASLPFPLDSPASVVCFLELRLPDQDIPQLLKVGISPAPADAGGVLAFQWYKPSLGAPLQDYLAGSAALVRFPRVPARVSYAVEAEPREPAWLTSGHPNLPSQIAVMTGIQVVVPTKSCPDAILHTPIFCQLALHADVGAERRELSGWMHNTNDCATLASSMPMRLGEGATLCFLDNFMFLVPPGLDVSTLVIDLRVVLGDLETGKPLLAVSVPVRGAFEAVSLKNEKPGNIFAGRFLAKCEVALSYNFSVVFSPPELIRPALDAPGVWGDGPRRLFDSGLSGLRPGRRRENRGRDRQRGGGDGTGHCHAGDPRQFSQRGGGGGGFR